MDIGANYWSVWNWHNISARHILSYYEKFPAPIDTLARRIGYRVRPAWIWSFKKDDATGLVIGLVNNGTCREFCASLSQVLMEKSALAEVSTPAIPKPAAFAKPCCCCRMARIGKASA